MQRFFINISFPFPTRHKLDGTLKAVSCGDLSQSLGSVRRLSPDFCNVCHRQADKLTVFIVKQKHCRATKYEQALIRHLFRTPLTDSTPLPLVRLDYNCSACARGKRFEMRLMASSTLMYSSLILSALPFHIISGQ